MAGNKDGNKKTAQKLLERDPDYFKKLGRKGGKASTYRGFNDPEVAKRAGSKGGKARWGLS